jgi:hypothetical protein
VETRPLLVRTRARTATQGEAVQTCLEERNAQSEIREFNNTKASAAGPREINKVKEISKSLV